MATRPLCWNPTAGYSATGKVIFSDVVCHSEPVGLGMSLTKGALNPTNIASKIVLGALASGPVPGYATHTMPMN